MNSEKLENLINLLEDNLHYWTPIRVSSEQDLDDFVSLSLGDRKHFIEQNWDEVINFLSVGLSGDELDEFEDLKFDVIDILNGRIEERKLEMVTTTATK